MDMNPERILALLLAIVLLATAIQSFVSGRRLRKVAEASQEIHILVNSRLTLALKHNAELTKQNAELVRQLAEYAVKEERGD